MRVATRWSNPRIWRSKCSRFSLRRRSHTSLCQTLTSLCRLISRSKLSTSLQGDSPQSKSWTWLRKSFWSLNGRSSSRKLTANKFLRAMRGWKSDWSFTHSSLNWVKLCIRHDGPPTCTGMTNLRHRSSTLGTGAFRSRCKKFPRPKCHCSRLNRRLCLSQ
jgi:hypothetical protein